MTEDRLAGHGGGYRAAFGVAQHQNQRRVKVFNHVLESRLPSPF